MIRHAAAVAVALLLNTASLYAQGVELTVTTGSATVHKGPSTGSPVIGKAPRGTVLEVTRELGSWVKVSWPEAADGAGYVHVRSGSLTRGSSGNPTRPSGASSMRPANAAPSASTDQTSIASQPGMHSTYVAPPTHIVGFGARMGGAEFGFGGTARIWSRNQIGVQMDVSRATQNSSVAQERLTSLQFAPSAVYSFKDKMSESVWVRPYVGGGISFYRSSLSVTPDVGESVTDNGVGYQTFGGAELTFPSVPRFAISGDVGYQWAPTPFTGFDVGGMSFSFSGHWYVK